MNKYEIMFIVRSDIDDDTRKKTVTSLEKILASDKSTITLSKELGQMEFAYEIKNFKSGYYYLYNIETPNSNAIKEFDRVAKINENVVRHLVLKTED